MLCFWGLSFSSYFASEALVFNYGLLAIARFWCTYWKLSCTSIDHSGAISLVWTTCGFYPYFKGFSTLNKLCLLCAIDFLFLLYIFIGPPHKFLQVKGNLIALPFLLCYSVCYCVGRFPLIKVVSKPSC